MEPQLFESQKDSNQTKAADQLLKSVKPGFRYIVNQSMYANDPPNFLKMVETLKKNNIPIVISSGNSWIFGTYNVSQPLETAAKEQDAILVGSLNLSGFQSAFSQQSTEISISVPSEQHVTSRINGSFESFGGTSAAAPMATGAIANVMAALPEINARQIKTLLRKTAIPTPATLQSPQLNGAGMLNAYKLIEVAKRIRAACSRTSSTGCISLELEKDTNYIFEVSVSQLKQAKAILPTCKGNGDVGKTQKKTQCSDLKSALKTLRSAAFLATKAEYWEQLSCVYSSIGLTQESRFYATLAGWNSTEYLEKIVLTENDNRMIYDLSRSELGLKLIKENLPELKKKYPALEKIIGLQNAHETKN